jgi:hypothetical protein
MTYANGVDAMASMGNIIMMTTVPHAGPRRTHLFYAVLGPHGQDLLRVAPPTKHPSDDGIAAPATSCVHMYSGGAHMFLAQHMLHHLP